MGNGITKPCGSLVLATLQLLADRPRWMSYNDIVRDLETAPCNVITEIWLSNFVRGVIKLPDVDRVQTLYEYLAKKPLSLD